MVMLDVQRRQRILYKLRAGDKQPDKHGKLRPSRLDGQLRVTSETPEIVDAFADTYGGTRSEWEGAWQVYLPVSALPVVLLPGQALSQWWEVWDSGGCLRRCDGVTETLSQSPCSCPSSVAVRMDTKDACRPTTRLSVVCPDVAVLGAGMLVSHGLIAAETLPQAVGIAEQMLSRGQHVPATLRMVTHRGRRTYVVPQLEIVGVSLASLGAAEAPQGLPAPNRPQIAPAAAPEPLSALSAPVEASHDAHMVQTPVTILSEERTAWPVPDPAHLERVALVREAIGALDEDQRADLMRRWVQADIPPLGQSDLTEDHLERAAALVVEVTGCYRRRCKAANAALRKAGIVDDDDRHRAVADATGGHLSSTAHLAEADLAMLLRWLDERGPT